MGVPTEIISIGPLLRLIYAKLDISAMAEANLHILQNAQGCQGDTLSNLFQ